MAVAGAIAGVTLAGRNMSVTSDSDVTRQLGGYTNELEQNGDGTTRIIKSRVSWKLSGVNVEIDDTRGDAEFIQSLADRPDFFPVTVTYVNGVTYQGSGQILSELEHNSGNTTMSLTLGGAGQLTKQ